MHDQESHSTCNSSTLERSGATGPMPSVIAISDDEDVGYSRPIRRMPDRYSSSCNATPALI